MDEHFLAYFLDFLWFVQVLVINPLNTVARRKGEVLNFPQVLIYSVSQFLRPLPLCFIESLGLNSLD